MMQIAFLPNPLLVLGFFKIIFVFQNLHFIRDSSISSFAKAERVTLLDTTKEANLNWLRYTPYSDASETQNGWLEESYIHNDTNGGQLIWRSYVVCDIISTTSTSSSDNIADQRDNWLRTPLIATNQKQRPYDDTSDMVDVDDAQFPITTKHFQQASDSTKTFSTSSSSSPFTQGDKRVYVELMYNLRDCRSYRDINHDCKETFEVYYSYQRLTQHSVPANNRRLSHFEIHSPKNETQVVDGQVRDDWKLLDKVAPSTDNLLTTNGISQRTLSFSINASIWKGFYLAFHDSGACLSLLAVKVYTLYCGSGFYEGFWVPGTPTGSDLTSVIQARAQCLPHSSLINSNSNRGEAVNSLTLPNLLCKSDGEWFESLSYHKLEVRNESCVCHAGYGASLLQNQRSLLKSRTNTKKNKNLSYTCTACEVGKYKHSSGNYGCSYCPANSESQTTSARECKCQVGYYKPSSIFYADTPCTKPPGPVNLKIIEIQSDTVILTWHEPQIGDVQQANTGQITFPITYRVYYDDDYVYGITNLTWMKVEGLKSDKSYRFTVQSENMISKLAGYSNNASITVDIPYEINLPIKHVNVNYNVKDNSAFITWNRNDDVHGNYCYEIVYYPQPTNENLDEIGQIFHNYQISLQYTTNATLRKLIKDTRYRLKMKVWTSNKKGVSKFTSPQYFTTFDGFQSDSGLNENKILKYFSSVNEVPELSSSSLDDNGQDARNLPAASPNKGMTMTLIATILVITLAAVIIIPMFIYLYHRKHKQCASNKNSSDCDSLGIRATEGPTSKKSNIMLEDDVKSFPTNFTNYQASKEYHRDFHTYEEPENLSPHFPPPFADSSEIARIDPRLIIKDSSILIWEGSISNIYKSFMCVSAADDSQTKPVNEKDVIKRAKSGTGMGVNNLDDDSRSLESKTRLNVVTIKVLKNLFAIPGKASPQEKVFWDEVKFLNKLPSQHFPKVIGYLYPSTQDCVAYVMAYEEYGKLEQFLKTNEFKLTRNESLNIVLGISDGMSYLYDLHPQGSHKRLKSANVLVDQNMKPKIIKLDSYFIKNENTIGIETDFEGVYANKDGDTKVSVRWTAPEIFLSSDSDNGSYAINQYFLINNQINLTQSNNIFNESTDSWSFGVLCWEIFSYAEKPYHHNWSNHDILSLLAIKGYRLPPPIHCPEVIHQLMLSCWHKIPNKRPKFNQISHLIRHLMNHEKHILNHSAHIKTINLDPFGADTFDSIEDWLNGMNLGRYTPNFEALNLLSLPQIYQFLHSNEVTISFNETPLKLNIVHESESFKFLLNSLSIKNRRHRIKILTSLETLKFPFPPIQEQVDYDLHLSLIYSILNPLQISQMKESIAAKTSLKDSSPNLLGSTIKNGYAKENVHSSYKNHNSHKMCEI